MFGCSGGPRLSPGKLEQICCGGREMRGISATNMVQGWGNPCPHTMSHALTPVPFRAASSRVPEGLCSQHKGRCPGVAWQQINNQKDQQCTKQRGARAGPWQQKPE